MKEGIELGGHQTESLWQGFRTRGSREAPLLPRLGAWETASHPLGMCG